MQPPGRTMSDPLILLVDDDPQFIYLMQRYAGTSGCRLISASGENQAIALAQQTQPALVIVGVMLAGVSGQTILRTLKSAPATCHIPIVLCSTLETPLYDWEEEADARLLKPILVDDFLATLVSMGIIPARPPDRKEQHL
jgi:CheY-like chemotaxis protein